jgi:predicted nucleotidyltransferase
MLKENFRKLEERILEEALSCYGDRLLTVAVYGSAARETQRFDSDLDLLIVARDLPQGRMKRVREFDTVEGRVEPDLKALQAEGISTCISVVIKSPEEAERGSPLFLDMTQDARILLDREGFFSAILDRLRKRLAELGARRIRRGNFWYWELKPDYKPGDIFEL